MAKFAVWSRDNSRIIDIKDVQTLLSQAGGMKAGSDPQAKSLEGKQEPKLSEAEPRSRYSEPGKGLRFPEAGQGSKFSEAGKGPNFSEAGPRSRYSEPGKGLRFPEAGQGSKFSEAGKGPNFSEAGPRSRFSEAGQWSRFSEAGQRSRLLETGQRSRFSEAGERPKTFESERLPWPGNFEVFVHPFLAQMGSSKCEGRSSSTLLPRLSSQEELPESVWSFEAEPPAPRLTTETIRNGGLQIKPKVHHIHPRPRPIPTLSVASHKVQVKPLRSRSVETKKKVATSVDTSKIEDVARMRQEQKCREQEQKIVEDNTYSLNLSASVSLESHLLEQASLARHQWEKRGMEAAMSKVKIVVVGAGLAGLSAADRLISLGFEHVVILEALDRLGGRVHTVHFGLEPGDLVEMGAPQLDLFGRPNSMTKLAQQFDLDDVISQRSRGWSDILQANGVRAEADLLAPVVRACKFLDKDQHLLYSLVRGQSGDNVCLSSKDYLRERHRRLVSDVSQAVGQDISGISQIIKTLVDFGRLYQGDDQGNLAIELLGLQNMRSRAGPDITWMRPSSGMTSLLAPLTASFKPDTVRFNTQVTRVEWNLKPDKKPRRNDQRVLVTCSDGRKFWASHVIMTVPVGHLKQNVHRLFQPPLPKEKLDAIEKIGFGIVSQAFLLYRNIFWSGRLNFIWPGSTTSDNEMLTETLRVSSLLWNTRVLELSMLGNKLEHLPESDIVEGVTTVLKLLLKIDIPEPVAVTKTGWSQNPNFGGTHPYLSAGCSEKTLDQLEKPLLVQQFPVVLFAGDYTYKHYLPLTHAARSSGLREAERVFNFHNRYHGYDNINE